MTRPLNALCRHSIFAGTIMLALVVGSAATGAAHRAHLPDDGRSVFRKAPYLVFHGDAGEMHVMW